jgi:hypothetical protein
VLLTVRVGPELALAMSVLAAVARSPVAWERSGDGVELLPPQAKAKSDTIIARRMGILELVRTQL